jgi:alkylation response protein AidB-like acyl-CoA dehydrogenase
VNFSFNDEQEMLRVATRRYLEAHQPLTRLRPLLEAPEVVDRQAWRDAAALGWTAMLVPPEHDGGAVTGQPVVDLVVLAEELGRALHPGPFVPTNAAADAIARVGTGDQHKGFLGPIARGECMAAWCLSADGTPDEASCEVGVRPQGDRYVVDGIARLVHGATVADVFLVLGRTPTGLVHLLVRAGLEGITIRPQQCFDLTRRFAEVAFESVAVERSDCLPGDAVAVLERAVELATVLQAAEAVGAADHVFRATVTYLENRVQFGRTIASFQAIKHRLADLFILVEGMRAATHYAALAVDEDFDDRREAVSTAGAFVGDGFARLCGEALQLHGGIGFSWEHDLHLFLRRAKTNQALYGDPSWHRERLCSLAEATADERGS